MRKTTLSPLRDLTDDFGNYTGFSVNDDGEIVDTSSCPFTFFEEDEKDVLYKIYNDGWSRLSAKVRGKTVITTLSSKQRSVAKLAAFGLTNKEIADKLGMSLSGVKQALTAVTDKLGVGRDKFAAFL